MREIKFRAYGEIQCYYLTAMGWKPEKKMCEVSSLNIKTNKCRVLYKGENGTNEFNTFELSKVNLMQYTGLKDKNGVEIYEGDINQCGYVIKYCEEKALFGEYSTRNGIDYNILMSYPIDSKSQIIKGNIYENPEILNNAL